MFRGWDETRRVPLLRETDVCLIRQGDGADVDLFGRPGRWGDGVGAVGRG